MDKSTDNYHKVLDLLKRSRPGHAHPDILEEKIMESIRMHNEGGLVRQSFAAFLFGWTRIVWVRRAFSASAAILILFLAYQQSLIIRQIRVLNQQMVPANPGNSYSGATGGMELLLYRLSAGRDTDITDEISEDTIEELIGSFGMMTEKYRELIRLIDEDPELKKLIEKKLEDRSKKGNPEKIKL